MLKKLLLIALLFGAVTPLYAVSDKEMEQARVITAQLYLRYANNGSGYLDDLSPKTMEELEAGLKTKEKENIKAFKSIAIAKDYASWDKAKLAEYWSKTVLSSPGLKDEGRGARTRVRQRIEKMEVSAPAPAAEAAETPVQEEKPAENASAAQAAPETPEAVLEEQVQALEEQAAADADTEPVVEKKSSSTWIYILILCVLVGVVIWLVVYAGNAMKSQNAAAAAAPAPKDNKENNRLKGELEQLRSENEYLKKELERLKRKNSELRSSHEPEQVQPAVVSAPAPRSGREPRTIYLGRVNKNGIFVRADRNFTPGSSFYKLVTTDGISGSFAPVEDEQTWAAALAQPEETLAHGCAGRNLLQPEGMTEIITEAPGTAVFEGGCWRVSRKARVALA